MKNVRSVVVGIIKQSVLKQLKVNRQAKINSVETNPENTHSHKIAHISASRDDKSNL